MEKQSLLTKEQNEKTEPHIESYERISLEEAEEAEISDQELLIHNEKEQNNRIHRENVLLTCKSLENFDENSSKISNDSELLCTNRSISRSSGYISEMKDTSIDLALKPKHRHLSTCSIMSNGSPTNTRIFTGSRYIHCEDSSCSEAPVPLVQLQHINGQIIMMPKQANTDTTTGENIGKLFYNSQPWMMRYETSQSSDSVFCRICHSCGDEERLIAPCKCAGSSRYVHATCLVTWFKKSVKHECELCKSDVKIRKINHKIALWRKPEDRPVPLIWFTVFFIGLFLNIVSIYVNASDLCESTACLIFYVVNGFGIILDAAFLWFWFLKCRHYWKKWCALNQDWYIDDPITCDEEPLQVQYVHGCPV